MKEEYQESVLVDEALTISATFMDFRIISDDDYNNGMKDAKIIKTKISEIEAWFAPLKDAAYQAHKKITQREKEVLTPLKETDNRVRIEMSKYATEKERMRREEQQRLIAEAERKAEIEREKLLKQDVKAEEKGKEDKAEELIEKAETVFAEPVFVDAPKLEGTREDIDIALLNRK